MWFQSPECTLTPPPTHTLTHTHTPDRADKHVQTSSLHSPNSRVKACPREFTIWRYVCVWVGLYPIPNRKWEPQRNRTTYAQFPGEDTTDGLSHPFTGGFSQTLKSSLSTILTSAFHSLLLCENEYSGIKIILLSRALLRLCHYLKHVGKWPAQALVCLM